MRPGRFVLGAPLPGAVFSFCAAVDGLDDQFEWPFVAGHWEETRPVPGQDAGGGPKPLPVFGKAVSQAGGRAIFRIH